MAAPPSSAAASDAGSPMSDSEDDSSSGSSAHRQTVTAAPVGGARAGGASAATFSREQSSDSDSEAEAEMDALNPRRIKEAEAFADISDRNLHPSFLNYGMPLAADARVVHLDQRYLLPSPASEGKDEAGEGRVLTALLRSTFGHRTLGIRSPMDTGKTHAYFAYLTAMLRRFPELRVLLITARITLSSALHMRAAESDLGFIRYNQVARSQNSYLQKQSRVIVQLDSLPRLIPSGRSAAPLPFDIVLIDEGESTLLHMSASSMGRNADVWRCFQNVCNSCTQLIALDADLGSRLHWMLEHFHQRTKQPVMATSAQGAEFAQSLGATVMSAYDRADLDSPQASPAASLSGSDQRHAMEEDHSTVPSMSPRAGVHLIVNDIKTDHRRYVRICTEAAFYAMLRTLLEQGQRVVIPVNLKVSAVAIKKFIETHFPFLRRRILIYHGRSDPEEKAKTADCNVEWSKVDVVIYTPTIVYGVDFNPPVAHFHSILAWGVATSNPVREFTQMLGRVRRLITGKVYVYTPEAPRSASRQCEGLDLRVMREKIESDILHNWNRLNQAGALDPMLRDEVRVGGKLEVRYHDPLYRELYIQNELECRLSASHFAAMFWHAVRERIADPTQVLHEEPLNAGGAGAVVDSLQAQIQQALELDARATQQFLRDCAAIAVAVETDPRAAAERAVRIQANHPREEDHPFRDLEQLRTMFHLQQLSTTTPPAGQQRIAMTALARYHGDKQHRDFFERFCQASTTQGRLMHQWTSTASDQQRLPLKLKEAQTVSDAHVIKGLLAMVGFVRRDGVDANPSNQVGPLSGTDAASSPAASLSSSPSPSTAATAAATSRSAASVAPWDPCAPDSPTMAARLAFLASPISGRQHSDVHDIASLEPQIAAADICSDLPVDTISINKRLQNPAWHAWLREAEELFERCGIQFKVKAEYDVAYVTKLLDRTLRRLLGFGLVSSESKRHREVVSHKTSIRPKENSLVSSDSKRHPEVGPRKKTIRRKVTRWELESDFRDSMLELAYSLSTDLYSSEHRLLGDWNVAQTVATLRPPFRWHLLTGIDAASCGATVVLPTSGGETDNEDAISTPPQEDIFHDDDEEMLGDMESNTGSNSGDSSQHALALLDVRTKRYSDGMIDSHTRQLSQQHKKRKLEEEVHSRRR